MNNHRFFSILALCALIGMSVPEFLFRFIANVPINWEMLHYLALLCCALEILSIGDRGKP